MKLPRVVAGLGALLARQASLLPTDYCFPSCPSCRDDVGNFGDGSTACVANSSFIENCGACQTCILTHSITEDGADYSDQLNGFMVTILNFCQNTTVSSQVAALQSQASLLSVIGQLAVIKSTSLDSALASMVLTVMIPSTPSATATSTAESGFRTSTSTSQAAGAKVTAASTSISTAQPSSTGTPAPLSETWIAGPVVGSVLGMSTVFIVIFFTRRKQRQAVKMNMVQYPPPKEFHDDRENDSNSNHTHIDTPQPPDPERPESIQPQEVESIEVHELPAREPVGSELSTPLEARMRPEEEMWPVSPLPLSPLPLLFAMSELRDGRAEAESPKHDTFYRPSGYR